MTLADPITLGPWPAAAAGLPPLEGGDRLEQRTFHARYAAMPGHVKAELVGGRVFMASPVSASHGGPLAAVVTCLGYYQAMTPGVRAFTDVTTILGDDSEPQPNACLRIVRGGQARLTDDQFIRGCPELVVEVASSTESYDLHDKLADYEKYAALEYVVVLVRTRRVVWLRRAGDKLVATDPDADKLHRSAVFPGLWLDPEAVLAGDTLGLINAVNKGVGTPEHAAFVAKITAAAGP